MTRFERWFPTTIIGIAFIVTVCILTAMALLLLNLDELVHFFQEHGLQSLWYGKKSCP